MIGKRRASLSRMLPLGHDAAQRWLPWVYALPAFVAVLAGIGLLAIADGRRALPDRLAADLAIQLPAETSNARVQTLLAALRQTAGVRSAELVTPAETARLLEPWLGTPAPLDELPVPRLIEASVDPDRPPDLDKLRQQLASVVPELRIDDQRDTFARLHTAADRLLIVLAAMTVAALLGTAALAGFAAGALLATRRAAIELLHLLGAANLDIARPLALRSLRHAALGGAMGAAAALLAVAALRGASDAIRVAAPTAAIDHADWRMWLIAAAATLGIAAIAATTTLASVLRRLAGMP